MAWAASKGEMPRAYDPGSVEGPIYKFWNESGFFRPEIDHSKKPFVVIMPPPNVTGELHMGHALTIAVEDLMVRWHRMLGEPALYLPGSDHAGIATQVVVERQLASEGSLSECGPGLTTTVTESTVKLSDSALPVTGVARRSHWMLAPRWP